MKSLAESAAEIFNRVMERHSYNLHALAGDFTIGSKCILPAINHRGVILANQLFDLVFPKLSSGMYYHYMTMDAFEKVVEHGCLRFFSTKKMSSEGEFIPLCQDLGLDGYWRIDEDGSEVGEHANLMDDLFYKSFVSCPDTNTGRLWETFAGNGTGARIAVQIDVHPDYTDFRRVSYQDSKSIEILKDLLDTFRAIEMNFAPFGISRMPAYHQLRDYAYQNECRLIAKRIPEARDSFPFQVVRDEGQQCNYIDCSLESPTCSAFQLKLVGVTGGHSCDEVRLKSLSQTLDIRDAGPTALG
jgi:hypothetical protein